jgi:hypothetical protein
MAEVCATAVRIIAGEIVQLLLPPELGDWGRFACVCKLWRTAMREHEAVAWHYAYCAGWGGGEEKNEDEEERVTVRGIKLASWRARYIARARTAHAESARLRRDFHACLANMQRWRWGLSVQLSGSSTADSHTDTLDVPLLPASAVQVFEQSLMLSYTSPLLDSVFDAGQMAVTLSVFDEGKGEQGAELLFMKLRGHGGAQLRSYSVFHCEGYTPTHADELELMTQSHELGLYVYRDEQWLHPMSPPRPHATEQQRYAPTVVVAYIHAVEFVRAVGQASRWHACDLRSPCLGLPCTSRTLAVRLDLHTFTGKHLGCVRALLRWQPASGVWSSHGCPAVDGFVEPSSTHLADFVIFDSAFPLNHGFASEPGVGRALGADDGTEPSCMADCGLEVWLDGSDPRLMSVPFTTNVADIVTDENRFRLKFAAEEEDGGVPQLVDANGAPVRGGRVLEVELELASEPGE